MKQTQVFLKIIVENVVALTYLFISLFVNRLAFSTINMVASAPGENVYEKVIYVFYIKCVIIC